MSLEELDEDVRCIAIITEGRSKTELKEHVKLTKEAITQQIVTAVSIEEDYEHLKHVQVIEGEQREQLIITGRMHFAAKVSKERYLALCAHCSLSNKCYAFSYLDEQEESGYNIDEPALREMSAHIKEIDKVIRRIEKRHHVAEGNLRSAANRKDEADKQIIRILNDKLAERDREIFSLRATMAILTTVQQPAPYNAEFGCQVGPELSNAQSQTEVAEVIDVEQAPLAEEDNERLDICGEKDDSLMLLDQDSDDEQMNDDEQMDDERYLGHLIHEAEHDESPPSKEYEKNKEIKRKQEECKTLLEDIAQLGRDLNVFPHRVYGEVPRGTHQKRQRALRESTKRSYALAAMSRTHQEDASGRPYFYCEKLKGTIAARLMPRDSGHQKSLCTVPDEKETLRRWIEELKERYIGLMRETIAMKEDNAEARVSLKATFRGK
ncbi:unnamed protein product [Cylicostephanus goldi]|uniref:Uncharacterized protein n=1 Tax=Cylicostephanus goldi TaxID=71465 RepID=A0A3P7MDH0_CYLGO|nr:unnamed protein product [Cylicostephanus goldi]